VKDQIPGQNDRSGRESAESCPAPALSVTVSICSCRPEEKRRRKKSERREERERERVFILEKEKKKSDVEIPHQVVKKMLWEFGCEYSIFLNTIDIYA